MSHGTDAAAAVPADTDATVQTAAQAWPWKLSKDQVAAALKRLAHGDLSGANWSLSWVMTRWVICD